MKWWNRLALPLLIAMAVKLFLRHDWWWIMVAFLSLCNIYFHWGVKQKIYERFNRNPR